VSQYQKGKTNLDFTEARDSEWQWHQLGHMQVCTSLQTDNHASTHHSVFYRPDGGCPSCRPTNSVKALKAKSTDGALQKRTTQQECGQSSHASPTAELKSTATPFRHIAEARRWHQPTRKL